MIDPEARYRRRRRRRRRRRGRDETNVIAAGLTFRRRTNASTRAPDGDTPHPLRGETCTMQLRLSHPAIEHIDDMYISITSGVADSPYML
jgi:hypothetical protein